MKRCIWLLSAIAATMLVAAAAAPSALAGCVVLQTFDTGVYPNYTYTQPAGWPASGSTSDPSGDGSGHIGAFWEPGRRGTGQDSGTYPDNEWWIRFGTGYGWYLLGNMTDGRINGCPGVPPANDPNADDGPEELIILLQDKADDDSCAWARVARPSFNVDRISGFAMSDVFEGWPADQSIAEIPRPEVLSSSRVDADTVSLDLNLPDVAGNFQGFDAALAPKDPYATITGYSLCTREQARTMSPPDTTPRETAMWNCSSGPATGNGGAQVNDFQVDCTNPGTDDIFVALALEVDGSLTDYVGKAVQVECRPNIVNPIVDIDADDNRVAPKKGTTGRGTRGRTGRGR